MSPVVENFVPYCQSPVVTLQWTVINLTSMQPITSSNYEGMKCKGSLPIGMVTLWRLTTPI